MSNYLYLLIIFLSANHLCFSQDIILKPNSFEEQFLKLHDINKDGVLTKNEALNITKLTLTNRLRDEPDINFLVHFENVKELSIYDHEIVQYQDVIFKLKNLENLTIYGKHDSQGVMLPDRFDELQNLENLTFHSLKSSEIIVQSIFKIPNLKKIRISKTELTSLPNGFSKLTNLEDLYISNAQITDITPLCNCTNLKKIEITNSNISFIPQCIKKIRTLEILDLTNNKLSEIPNEIKGLISLQKIRLSKNNFKSFPSQLLTLTNIESINLGSFKFNFEIPNEIKKLKRLKSFPIGLNNKFPIPKSLYLIDSIKSISLKGFQLTQFPPNIFNRKSLTSLNLMDNKISVIPNEIKALTNLIKLNLENNKISIIPKEIKALTQLTNLNLKNNQIDNIPKDLSEMPHLSHLDFSFNMISVFPEHLGKLKKLRTLVLDDNLISDISFKKNEFIKLDKLTLANNKLKKIPPKIEYLKQLEKLDIKNNTVVTYPSALCNMNPLLKLTNSKGEVIKIEDHCKEPTNFDYTEHVYSDHEEKMSFTELLFHPDPEITIISATPSKVNCGDCSLELGNVIFHGGKKLDKYKVRRGYNGTNNNKPCTYFVGLKYMFVLRNYPKQPFLPKPSYSGPIDDHESLNIPLKQKQLIINNFEKIATEYSLLKKQKYSGKKDFYFKDQLMASGNFNNGIPTGEWIHYFLGRSTDTLVRSKWNIIKDNNYNIETYKYSYGHYSKEYYKEFNNERITKSIDYNGSKQTVSTFDYSDPNMRIRNSKTYDKEGEITNWRTGKLHYDRNDPLYKQNNYAINTVVINEYNDEEHKGYFKGWEGKLLNGFQVGTWTKTNKKGQSQSRYYDPAVLPKGIVQIATRPTDFFEGRMDGSKKEGEWKLYSKGKLVTVMNFENNLLQGEYVKHKDGSNQNYTIFNYHNGQKNGTFKKYKDGQLIEIGNYSNDLKQGLSIKIHRSGSKFKCYEEMYLNEKLHGKKLVYYRGVIEEDISIENSFLLKGERPPIENMIRFENYQRGYKQGKSEEFENGKLLRITNFQEGLRVGASYLYHDDGSYTIYTYQNIEDKDPYSLRTKNIPSGLFDKDGNLISNPRYDKNGKRIPK